MKLGKEAGNLVLNGVCGKERISLHIPRSSGPSDDVMKITEIVPNYVLV